MGTLLKREQSNNSNRSFLVTIPVWIIDPQFKLLGDIGVKKRLSSTFCSLLLLWPVLFWEGFSPISGQLIWDWPSLISTSINQFRFRFRYRTETKIVVSVVHCMMWYIIWQTLLDTSFFVLVNRLYSVWRTLDKQDPSIFVPNWATFNKNQKTSKYVYMT